MLGADVTGAEPLLRLQAPVQPDTCVRGVALPVLDFQCHRHFAAIHIGCNGRDFASLLFCFFFPGKLSAVEPLIPGSLPRALWEII